MENKPGDAMFIAVDTDFSIGIERGPRLCGSHRPFRRIKAAEAAGWQKSSAPPLSRNDSAAQIGSGI